MFAPFNLGIPRRQVFLRSVSVGLHLLLLGLILHSPAPTFVAPSLLTKGDGGSSLTHIYFGGRAGVTQAHPLPRVFRKEIKTRSKPELAPLSAKMEKGNAPASSPTHDAPAAGSVFGSLGYGPLSGFEVRPALPVVSLDPVVPPQMLDGIAGDVIIEITIDTAGNITDMKVLQSFNPPVDQKVLAALEKWHFLPATRDGLPIPSKQDVHYHFPR
jgi:TonB family protein